MKKLYDIKKNKTLKKIIKNHKTVTKKLNNDETVKKKLNKEKEKLKKQKEKQKEKEKQKKEKEKEKEKQKKEKEKEKLKKEKEKQKEKLKKEKEKQKEKQKLKKQKLKKINIRKKNQKKIGGEIYPNHQQQVKYQHEYQQNPHNYEYYSPQRVPNHQQQVEYPHEYQQNQDNNEYYYQQRVPNHQQQVEYPYEYQQNPDNYEYYSPQRVQNRQQQVKLLSRGGYGCVINRSLDLLNIDADIIPARYTIDKNLFITEDKNDKYITKISRDEISTYAEINMNIKLINIYQNQYFDSFLPILKKYAVYSDIRRLNIPSISKCLSSISNSNKNIFGEIVYEKSGLPLSDVNFKFDLYLDLLIIFFKNLKDFHDKGFVHRDIKNDNVLYNAEKNKLVLIDFGTTYNKSDINNGNFFDNSNINQLSNNPHIWFNTGLEYLLIHPNLPYKLSDRLIKLTPLTVSNRKFIKYLNGQLQFINNFTLNTLKNYFYATDYYACGLMMNQMVNNISFKNINEKNIYDHITYILTLINPQIRTEAFENMILIFDKYKNTNDITQLNLELIELFTNKYIEQQYNEKYKKQEKTEIVKIDSINDNNIIINDHVEIKKDIDINYNYNGENLKYLPNEYKKKKENKFYIILKDLFKDFKYALRN